ncbi:hypothetical protein T07_14526 [Trichinella nelsoni]|uniref:Uncharacterized protein n=1 Tax=Trichinella nelsoni TaxID=6336 RepID=A0A0V0SG63_9BILA|nr:hypothetical protein T07_14526 [Trichinella nelsoni]
MTNYSMNRDRMMIVQIEMFICKNNYSKFLKLKNGKWKLKHLFINGSALVNISRRDETVTAAEDESNADKCKRTFCCIKGKITRLAVHHLGYAIGILRQKATKLHGNAFVDCLLSWKFSYTYRCDPNFS